MPTLLASPRAFEGDLIVFDKDGVLLDFDRLWAETTRLRVEALCERVGRPAIAPALTACLGIDADGRVDPEGLLAVGSAEAAARAAAAFLALETGLAAGPAGAIAREGFAAAATALDYAAACRPLPGVAAALRALHEAGWLLAIATSDTHAGALRFLHHAGLADCFIAVVGADRVARGKPDPASFWLACQEAGVAPERAAMVGDAPADLRMARAAGAGLAVGVLSGVGRRLALAPLADWLLDSASGLHAPG